MKRGSMISVACSWSKSPKVLRSISWMILELVSTLLYLVMILVAVNNSSLVGVSRYFSISVMSGVCSVLKKIFRMRSSGLSISGGHDIG